LTYSLKSLHKDQHVHTGQDRRKEILQQQSSLHVDGQNDADIWLQWKLENLINRRRTLGLFFLSSQYVIAI